MKAERPAIRGADQSSQTVSVDAETYLRDLQRESAFVSQMTERMNRRTAEMKRMRKATEKAILEAEASIAATKAFLKGAHLRDAAE